jgi:hypothetical protein
METGKNNMDCTADKRFLNWLRIQGGNTGPAPNSFARRKSQRPYIISLWFGVESFNS